MAISVIKKDFRRESFNRNKIIRAIEKAGASREIANGVARDVEEDISRVASSRIKDKVIRRLRLEDVDAAKTFENFRKVR